MNLDTFAKGVGGLTVAVWLIGNVASFFIPGTTVPHGLNFAATAVVTALFGGTALAAQKGKRNGGSDSSAAGHRGDRGGSGDE